MRVVIAPDSFGGTLSAVQAADAIARGWKEARPQDVLIIAPQSDGGPGFVDVLSWHGGSPQTSLVSGPLDTTTSAKWLLDTSESSSVTVGYIECAQACGLHLLPHPPTPQSALNAHSYGVGQLLAQAVARGAHTIVVGLGGSACTDAGRGMLAALAHSGENAQSVESSLLTHLTVAREILHDVQLIAATDVDHPLCGPQGAAEIFGPQKGADPHTVRILADRLRESAIFFSQFCGLPVAEYPGAGAAGGLGAALYALGATRQSGAEIVAQRTDRPSQLALADVVITGEGKLDHQSIHGKVVSALASDAHSAGATTLAMAGQVQLDQLQLRDAGISAAYSLSEFAGSVHQAIFDAANQLTALAHHVGSHFESANL